MKVINFFINNYRQNHHLPENGTTKKLRLQRSMTWWTRRKFIVVLIPVNQICCYTVTEIISL
ncbi:hypothetical protein QUF73_25250 [Cytobacillus sp. NJ13]|nr:hypothetical protein [Cytobacillus sp. NJ13]